MQALLQFRELIYPLHSRNVALHSCLDICLQFTYISYTVVIKNVCWSINYDILVWFNRAKTDMFHKLIQARRDHIIKDN